MTNKKITIIDGQSNNETELPVLDSILGPNVVAVSYTHLTLPTN